MKFNKAMKELLKGKTIYIGETEIFLKGKKLYELKDDYTIPQELNEISFSVQELLSNQWQSKE